MANGDEGITPMVEKLKDSTDILEIEQEVEIAAPGTFVPPEEGEVDVDIEIIPEEDGGVIIDFAPEEDRLPDEGDFSRNLAEELDDGVLGAISNDLQAK